jgi:hydrophobic/amphiphilic exporter-1 (mainly G- bacteria), HAE1 family
VNPIRAAVEAPYTVAVTVIFALLFSWIAWDRIPIQLKPTVDEPQITVATVYRGASAVEVEEQVTSELEDALQSAEGLVELTSSSSEGRSQITLEFEYGTSTRLAVVDVINKLSRVARLPGEADEPEVSIASPDETQPVMWIALESRWAPDRVRQLVDETIESRLERVAGVSSLLIVGGEEREVQVRFDPDALLARGVSLGELIDAIARANQNLRGGSVETPGRQLAVRTLGRALRPTDLADVIVKEWDGGSVRLGEVAEVVDGHAESTGFVRLNGTPGVAIGVRRQAGSNVVQMIEDLDVVVDELNATFAARGVDVHLAPVYRETTYINQAIAFVTSNLWQGSLLAILVLLWFLRSGRSVLIIALAIPISLAPVFIIMQALGRTLNVISLAGLAFASGMVVDNAIVVLENVFRHLQLGKSAREAAIEGGREVWGGVLASTLTTMAVFIPIILESDEASQLFVDIAIAIAAAVGVSLVVSLTVVPVLCPLLFRRAADVPQDEKGLGPFGGLYARFADWLAAPRPGAVATKVGFVLLVLAASLATVRLAPPAEYLPGGNRNMIMFFADPIPGTRPEETAKNVEPLERFILAQPETDRMFSVVGPRFNGGGFILKDEAATAEGLARFHGMLFGPAASLPGFRFVVPVRASIFSDPGKQFEVELSGPDFAALGRGAQLLEAGLRAVPGVQFVRSSLVTGNPELHVRIDEAKAKDLGLDVAEVGRVVETAIAGQRITSLIDGGREVDVNLVAPRWRIESAEDLEELRFRTRAGAVVALSSVATVERTTGPQSIRRLERERNVLLTVNIAPDAPLERVLEHVEREVFPSVGAQLGSAYTLGVGGAADKLRQTLGALTRGFWLSVTIMYLLLVALFRSWSAPVVILITVPLALAGGLVGIRVAAELSGGAAAFDVIAMLGFVILGGLVVNNAILILHQANNFEADGMSPRRALAESTRTRLRPILMSVITTIFGMVPLAIGGGAGAELYQGLGAVIVGGLTLSTLFTLFLVPILLSLGHDLADWRRARAARRREPAMAER